MFWRSENKRGGLLKRFRRDEKGVTALEFAMVGGPFLYLMGCIFETGLMLFSEQVIENGVNQAARMIRTGQVQTQGITSAQFKDLVCGQLSSFLECDTKLNIDIRKFTAFKDIKLPKPMSGDQLSEDVTTGAKFEPGGPSEVVVVRAYYQWELFMPGITQLANIGGDKRLLTAGAAFLNEPYAPPT